MKSYVFKRVNLTISAAAFKLMLASHYKIIKAVRVTSAKTNQTTQLMRVFTNQVIADKVITVNSVNYTIEPSHQNTRASICHRCQHLGHLASIVLRRSSAHVVGKIT